MSSTPIFPLTLETPAASPEEAHRYFSSRLSYETDASDVNYDMAQGFHDFILLDVRSASAYDELHAQGAQSLPYRSINKESTASFSKEKLIIVYCWGPDCNAAVKAGVRLTTLGFQVKEILGGIEYWTREGAPVEGTRTKLRLTSRPTATHSE
ncbi:rhodanese-related sulfurtransferase [Paenibacillus shirakamiensis]|uniref:Rhodanese-related sulfurtransferase n=1 Tax=Paenibacillus shirakamiensis TaxID=1265935 RepID=A0ABS4JGA2_9BACL|nr:rhodanese-like domain-containing protein [Paenibacillus shirakamiensis]MBP2000743.1 rhodanese-related sulfurtransferase [Paenibacillus shirakamiensis]